MRRFLMFPLTRIVLGVALVAVFIVPGMFLKGGFAATETTNAIGALAALLIVGRFIERRSPAKIGFDRHRAIPQLASGFALGAVILSTVIFVFWAAGWYKVVGQGSGSGNLAKALPAAIWAFLAGAVFEEAVARGIIFRITEEGLGSRGAIIVSSVFFGLGHIGNPHATLLAGIAIAIEAGVLLAAAFMLTRNLWMPIGLHWAWNLFEGPIFGTRVSGLNFQVLLRSQTHGPALWTGGRFGPEAGLVALIVSTAFGVALLAIASKKKQFVPPAWVLAKQDSVTSEPI